MTKTAVRNNRAAVFVIFETYYFTGVLPGIDVTTQ